MRLKLTHLLGDGPLGDAKFIRSSTEIQTSASHVKCT